MLDGFPSHARRNQFRMKGRMLGDLLVQLGNRPRNLKNQPNGVFVLLAVGDVKERVARIVDVWILLDLFLLLLLAGLCAFSQVDWAHFCDVPGASLRIDAFSSDLALFLGLASTLGNTALTALGSTVETCTSTTLVSAVCVGTALVWLLNLMVQRQFPRLELGQQRVGQVQDARDLLEKPNLSVQGHVDEGLDVSIQQNGESLHA